MQKMDYQTRLAWFCYWADFYNLKIIQAKYVPVTIRIMGEIVNFDKKEYAHYRDVDGVMSVVSSCNGSEVIYFQDSAWLIVNGKSVTFESRQAMAEFLWMATRFVDSEGRWEKEKYVGCDYV